VARQGTTAGTGAAAHLGIDLAEYDERIRTFIPGYDTMLDFASLALQVMVRRRAPLILDLGIGTGALAGRCLERLPAARFIGIDQDAQMLEAARARLGRALSRATHGSFERIALPACDAVVSSLALHHVPGRTARLRLFRRVRRALRRGGALVIADCYPESHPRLAAFDRAAWLAHLEASYTPSESRRYLAAWSREDHYAPLSEEIETLKRAGFRVDVPVRRQTWAVIVAT
jgi:tRNA (cmo5U34)-methyltransferase